MDSMRSKKYMTSEDEPPWLEGVQYATKEEWKAIANSSRKNEVVGQSRNNAQLRMCLVVKVNSNAVKINTP